MNPLGHRTYVRIFIELSGEHPTLPRAEALAAMEAERVEVRALSWNSRVLHLDGSGPVERAVRRLGLARAAWEELARGDLDALRAYAREVDLARRTFRVRAQDRGGRMDAHAVEEVLGAEFARTGRVDLTSPGLDLRVLLGDELVLGRSLFQVERSALEARKVARRRFARPISVHPKFARALVNLSRAPTGGLLLDPFCGTGGILLEASRLGMRALGSDISREMIEGARTSLRALEAEAHLATADAGTPPWRDGRVLAVASDLPYGRATSTHGEPLTRLYDRAFAGFAQVLPRGGFAAVVVPTGRAVEIGERHLELVERHEYRVHRSLTRIFCAFLKSH